MHVRIMKILTTHNLFTQKLQTSEKKKKDFDTKWQ